MDFFLSDLYRVSFVHFFTADKKLRIIDGVPVKQIFLN